MVEREVMKLVTLMKKESLIEEGREDQYTYVLIVMTEKIITIGTIVLISLFVHKLIPTLFFLLFFLTLRSRTGGFHLKTFAQCYIGTILIYGLVLLMSLMIANYINYFIIISFVATGVILFIGTVNHPDLQLNANELSESKIKARLLAMIGETIVLCMFLLKADTEYVLFSSLGIIICATLLGISKIVKQEVKK